MILGREASLYFLLSGLYWFIKEVLQHRIVFAFSNQYNRFASACLW
jgi:hypothetical protein